MFQIGKQFEVVRGIISTAEANQYALKYENMSEKMHFFRFEAVHLLGWTKIK